MEIAKVEGLAKSAGYGGAKREFLPWLILEHINSILLWHLGCGHMA